MSFKKTCPHEIGIGIGIGSIDELEIHTSAPHSARDVPPGYSASLRKW